MKKTKILLTGALFLLTAGGLSANTQGLLADLGKTNTEDTLKIVRNSDTTTIITNGKSFNFDTTIVIGNDSALLNGLSKTFILKGGDDGNWEFTESDSSGFFEGFFKEFMPPKHGNRPPKNNDCCGKKPNRKRTLSSDFAIGYGYLNWSDDGMFATPDGNDAYSLKWSSKWDFSYILNICPDNRLWVSTGLGLQSNVFRFDDTFALDVFNNSALAGSVSKGKFKLVARYITVPLMLNLRVAHNVQLHAGVVGGLNYHNSHTGFKQNFKTDGIKQKNSTGSSFNQFNTFKADATLGVQFYGLTFYASHSLTPIFKDSYGKELKPFAFGVIFGL